MSEIIGKYADKYARKYVDLMGKFKWNKYKFNALTNDIDIDFYYRPSIEISFFNRKVITLLWKQYLIHHQMLLDCV